MESFLRIMNLVGGLGLFLYGLHVMSDRIHKRATFRLKKLLGALTSNRFVGILTGLSITSIIQSSSATTVLLVSLVNAGLVSLEQSIGVIMGANIGTTFTAWVVSILGFKFHITDLALPAVALGIPLYFQKLERRRELGEILISFGVLFLGLHIMKESVPALDEDSSVLHYIASLSSFGYLSIILYVAIGTLLTVVLQSSSAAMAITITMAYKGWISFPLAAGVVLGENIGTTITAYIASLGMSPNARRAARVHMLFNVFGVFWMLLVFPFFTVIVDRIVPGEVTDFTALPIHLSAFHTLFNISNTLLLVGFVPQLASLVRRLIKHEPVPPRPTKYSLPFVPGNLPESVESNLINVRAEIGKMSDLVYDMLLALMNIIPPESEDIAETVENIKYKENLTDEMQEVLVTFLTGCTVESLSEYQAKIIYSTQRITTELERIADSCENMADLLDRRCRKQLFFHEKGVDELLDYTSLVLDFLRYNGDYLGRKVLAYDIRRAYKMERAINKQRNKLKKITQKQLATGADVRAELLFIDIVKNLEHIGDYSLNISQAMRQLG